MKKYTEVLGPEIGAYALKDCKKLCFEMVSDVPPTPLRDPQQEAKRMELQLMSGMEQIFESHEEASNLLVLQFLKLAPLHSEFPFEKAVEELQAISASQSLQEYQSFVQTLSQPEPPQPFEVFHLSQKTMDVLFFAANSILEEKKFKEAVKVFNLLSDLEPKSYRNWIGLGHSSYHAGKYQQALFCYYTASNLDPENPMPLVWAANACEKMKEFEAARDLLERAKVLAQESRDPEMTQLNEGITGLLAAIKK